MNYVKPTPKSLEQHRIEFGRLFLVKARDAAMHAHESDTRGRLDLTGIYDKAEALRDHADFLLAS